jgi:hypothetical protein
MAAHRVLGATAQVGWASSELPAPRNHQRGVLSNPQQLSLACASARSAAVSDRVSLLPPLAAGRHVAKDSRRAAGARAQAGWTQAAAERRDPRQPDGQRNRARRAERLRRGKKRSWDASGTSWWIRSACCGRSSSRQPRCKIVTAENSHSNASASGSSFQKSFGPTAPITPLQFGLGCCGAGASNWFADRAAGLKFYPSAGSWNARSAGGIAGGDWPNVTNALPIANMPSSSSP